MKGHEINVVWQVLPLAWLVHHGSTCHHSNSHPSDKGLPLSGHSSPLLSSPHFNSPQLNSVQAMLHRLRLKLTKALLNNKLNPELYSVYKKNLIPLDVITRAESHLFFSSKVVPL